ncbi:hypothetical protein Tco_0658457 [Tanacetum coccineum]
MIACLEKSEGNADFHEIVDFLTASTIHYALIVSLTIYASYIEQFWNTVHSQIVNNVKQIHATVDGKTVVISESSVRSDLHFNDEDGITCLTNDAIFENLALMGYESDSNKLTFQKALFSPQWKYLIHTILHCLSSKSTSWNEFSTNIASAVICLANGQKFNFSKLIFDGVHTPGSDEGRPNINELMAICKNLSVIRKLKKKVKRLEKKLRARTPRLDLFKIGISKRKSLDKENVSKQGRKSDKTRPMFKEGDFDDIDDMVDDAIKNVEGDAETQGRNSDKTEELNLSDKGSGGTKVFDDTTAAQKDVNAAEPVSTAGDAVTTASVIFDVGTCNTPLLDI